MERIPSRSEDQARREGTEGSVKRILAQAQENYRRFKSGQEDAVVFFNGDFADENGEKILLPDGKTVPYLGRNGLGDRLCRILDFDSRKKFIDFEVLKPPEGKTPAIRKFYKEAEVKKKAWGADESSGLGYTPTEMIYAVLSREENQATLLTVETYMSLYEPGEPFAVSYVLRRLKP